MVGGRGGLATQTACSWLMVVVGLWVCGSSHTTYALPAHLYLPLGLTYNLPAPASAKGLTITDVSSIIPDNGDGRDSAYQQRQAEEVAGVVRSVDAALQEYARRLAGDLGGPEMVAHGEHSTQHHHQQQQEQQEQNDKFPAPSKRYLGLEIPDFIRTYSKKLQLKQRMIKMGK